MAAGAGITAPKPGADVREVWAYANALQAAYFQEKQDRKDWANKYAALLEVAISTHAALERWWNEPDHDERYVTDARYILLAALEDGLAIDRSDV